MFPALENTPRKPPQEKPKGSALCCSILKGYDYHKVIISYRIDRAAQNWADKPVDSSSEERVSAADGADGRR